METNIISHRPKVAMRDRVICKIENIDEITSQANYNGNVIPLFTTFGGARLYPEGHRDYKDDLEDVYLEYIVVSFPDTPIWKTIRLSL